MEYNEHQRKSLWLYSAICPSIEKYSKIVGRLAPAEAIYDDPKLIPDRAITSDQRAALNKTRSESWIDDAIDSMQKRGMRFICRGDADYPQRLNLTVSTGAPELLFLRGNMAPDMSRLISVVGTRSADAEGVRIATKFAREVAEVGVGIVSGFALGIDAAAAEGALDGEGWYCGVLGCGVDVPYPADNQALLRRVLDRGGLFMSEYLPGMKGQPTYFPKRNRIIALLSMATVVIEAPARSGALNTAKHALDSGREVYVLPGSVLNHRFAGSNELLMKGGHMVLCARDVLESEGLIQLSDRSEDAAENKLKSLKLSDDEYLVMNKLAEGAGSFDALIAATGLGTAKLSALLSILKLKRVIEELPGRQYAIL